MEMRVFLWKSVGSLSDERGQLPPAVQRCNCKAAPRRKGHACRSDKWPSRMFPLRRKADGRIESSSSSVPSIVLPNPTHLSVLSQKANLSSMSDFALSLSSYLVCQCFLVVVGTPPIPEDFQKPLCSSLRLRNSCYG